MRLLSLLLLLLCAGAVLAADTNINFYVATAGSDANPGTTAKPFATLARAQQAVRGKVAAGLLGPLTVHVGKGTYLQTVPLVFGPEDAGTAAFPVTYAADPGATVVISGGRRISGWKRAEGDLWTADIPEVKAGAWYFRQLFIDNRRAVRARTPNASDAQPYWQIRNSNLAADRTSFTLAFDPNLVAGWANVADAEIIAFGNWETYRRRLKSARPADNSIELAPPFTTREKCPWNYPSANAWCYLENAREFLDQPGEWYLDRQRGQLTYKALPGEDLARAVVMAPVLTKLVEVTGTPDNPVRNLHFRGLQFAHVDWELPNGGYHGIQANHYMEGSEQEAKWACMTAALHFQYADSCSVENGALTHLGGVGIEVGQGCNTVIVQGNRIEDIGGTGVMVGGPNDEKLSPKEISVTNNVICRCAIDYQGGVGVWVGFAEGTRIEHNTIHHLPYTGVSVGWVWDPPPSACKRNSVAYNHIYHVMQRLADGGGIYTLGFQPDTVLRGNCIHDVERSQYAQGGAPNNGMFIDEGSKGFLIEDNTIYGTTGAPVRHNRNEANWHTWGKNNFLPTPPLFGEGKNGPGLLCSNGSQQNIPSTPALEPEQLTLEAWVNAAEIPVGTDNRRWIAGKNYNEWAEGHYALVIIGDRAGAYMNIGGGQDNAFLAANTVGTIKPNQWQHLAMTYDGVTLTCYCDGEAVASKVIDKKRTPAGGAFCMGARPDNFVAFSGGIDEVRLYNRALTADEIKARYTHPADPPPTGTAGYWSFTDQQDSTRDLVRQIKQTTGVEPSYRDRLLDVDEKAEIER